MSSESLHEAPSALSAETMDLHRAVVSLMEELEAIDWYRQRAEACADDELRSVLVHNKDEEVEHAMMVLEWIRRRDPVFARNVSTYLQSSGPLTSVESASESAGASAAGATSRSLGIGSLKSLAGKGEGAGITGSGPEGKSGDAKASSANGGR